MVAASASRPLRCSRSILNTSKIHVCLVIYTLALCNERACTLSSFADERPLLTTACIDYAFVDCDISNDDAVIAAANEDEGDY